jgi:hypothetical protein
MCNICEEAARYEEDYDVVTSYKDCPDKKTLHLAEAMDVKVGDTINDPESIVWRHEIVRIHAEHIDGWDILVFTTKRGRRIEFDPMATVRIWK